MSSEKGAILSRFFVMLDKLYSSDLSILDSEAFSKSADKKETDANFVDFNPNATFSGYVLVFRQDPAVAHYWEKIPNPELKSKSAPSDYVEPFAFPARAMYFSSESDATRTKAALAHAAKLCGAKVAPF